MHLYAGEIRRSVCTRARSTQSLEEQGWSATFPTGRSQDLGDFSTRVCNVGAKLSIRELKTVVFIYGPSRGGNTEQPVLFIHTVLFMGPNRQRVMAYAKVKATWDFFKKNGIAMSASAIHCRGVLG